MEINGVKLPTPKDFNATARTFRRMFNDKNPLFRNPSCYVKLNDGKLECYWGRTDNDDVLFSDGGLDVETDKVVLTSAFLYKQVFPKLTATIREVRLALAQSLARYDVARYLEIAEYYGFYESYFKEEWSWNDVEN